MTSDPEFTSEPTNSPQGLVILRGQRLYLAGNTTEYILCDSSVLIREAPPAPESKRGGPLP
jgi:hypothetical protein